MPEHLLDALDAMAAADPDRLFVRDLDGGIHITRGDLRHRAAALAGGLHARGIRAGDTVALLLSNRPEFYVADLAVLLLGGVPVSVYATSSPQQVTHVLRDSGARLLIGEPALLEPLGALDIDVLSVADLDAVAVPGFDPAQARGPRDPDEVLTIIYTSGTTGAPKGVELTHRGVLAGMRGLGAAIGLDGADRVISWLPAAHIAERGAHYYLPILNGGEITTLEDPRRIGDALVAVRPTWFFAVPRVWEKLKAAIEAQVAARGSADAFAGAFETAVEELRLRHDGRHVPEELSRRVDALDGKVFAPLRAALGLDQARVLNTGSAPTPPSVLEFFHAIGLPVSDLWGMTESAACGTAVPPARPRIGSVGLPLPGNDLEIADDGEILLRGPSLMRGYLGRPEATRDAIDEDGWLHTGDVGRIDDDGYLWIVDRKKEIIINAAGKNMSPSAIEAVLKSAHPLIGHVAVIGDGRPYNTALVVLDPDTAAAWGPANGKPGEVTALGGDPEVVALVVEAVETANAELSRVEQVKRLHIVEDQWVPGGEELTPTMKLRRAPIAAKYADQIEELYA
ncbi:MAG: AMP-binding protein [Solirubrobacteraceae bacterium]|nr:AMP-binding protein [Solirubrobacteraceae bacterium]